MVKPDHCAGKIESLIRQPRPSKAADVRLQSAFVRTVLNNESRIGRRAGLELASAIEASSASFLIPDEEWALFYQFILAIR